MEARYQRDREALLRRVNLDLEKLRLLLRLSHAQRALDHRAYEHAAEELLTVGRMIGGWQSQQRSASELEPEFERFAITDSYACRKGKGQHAAILRGQKYAVASRDGGYFKGDVKAYFASIPHERLKEVLKRRVKEPDVREVLERRVSE